MWDYGAHRVPRRENEKGKWRPSSPETVGTSHCVEVAARRDRKQMKPRSGALLVQATVPSASHACDASIPRDMAPWTHFCHTQVQREWAPCGADAPAGRGRRPGSRSGQRSCPPPDGFSGSRLQRERRGRLRAAGPQRARWPWGRALRQGDGRLGRWRLEDAVFKAILSYMISPRTSWSTLRPCLENQNEKSNKGVSELAQQ